MRNSLLGIFCLLSVHACAQTPYLIVGTYDSPKSAGLYVYLFNQADGSATAVSNVKTSNPSFVVVSPNKKYVYAVNENNNKEGKGGTISSFSFNKKTGMLHFINKQSSEGNDPCYITIDNTGKWIIAGNYSSGNFAILPTAQNGGLNKANQIVQHYGSGPDTTRQKSPHVHTTVLNKENTKLFVTDLGSDKLMCYDFNNENGSVKASGQKFIALEPGSGPRHIDISTNGKYIYVVKELTGSLSVLENKNNKLTLIQSVSTLPQNYTGSAGSADIHISPNGNFLYVSNRAESNTIAIFKINK